MTYIFSWGCFSSVEGARERVSGTLLCGLGEEDRSGLSCLDDWSHGRGGCTELESLGRPLWARSGGIPEECNEQPRSSSSLQITLLEASYQTSSTSHALFFLPSLHILYLFFGKVVAFHEVCCRICTGTAPVLHMEHAPVLHIFSQKGLSFSGSNQAKLPKHDVVRQCFILPSLSSSE